LCTMHKEAGLWPAFVTRGRLKMAVTIENLLRLVLPAGSRVVAGESGLHREVLWARSLRPRPPAFESLEGGELALISTAHLSLLEETMTLSYVLARLAEVPVAGVAVLGDVDQDAAAWAEQLSIPLIELPPTSSLVEVERAAVAAIVDWQAELQRRASDIHRQLAQLTFEEKGLQAVVDRTSEILGKPVVLEDDHFGILFSAAGGELSPPSEVELESSRAAVEQWIAGVAVSSTQPPVEQFALPGTPLARLVAPVAIREGVACYFSVIGRERELTELDRLAVARGAAVCAVEVAKEVAVSEAESRMRGDLLERLLSGSHQGDQSAVSQARRLGFDPTQPSIVIAFRVAGRDRSPAELALGGADRARVRLESLVRLDLARRAPSALVASRGGAVLALVPLESVSTDGDARELAEELRRRAEGALEGRLVAAGIGRPSGSDRTLVVSYREAEGALGVGVKVAGPSSTTWFGDLGIMRLLTQIGSGAELESFREEWLGRLEEHDRKSGGELTRTVEAYFLAHGNLTRTAELLSLHRNSLLYRLQRVREVGRLDLDDPDTRLCLQVALKIRQLLEADRSRRRAEL
jgi:PucR family transcriptional regulator, purine catabolism regulatory protein